MLLRMTRSCVARALLWSAGVALSAASTAAQKLEIAPAQIMSDEVATFRVTGLEPKAQVNLHAQLVDGAEQLWRSDAEFEADAAGVVDTSKQAPLKGSYKPVSAMGLVWSMMPVSKGVPAYRPPKEGQTIEVSASIGGRQVATAQLVERFRSDAVKRIEVTGKLHGYFFMPEGSGPHPGVLVVGGSEGGVPQGKAEWLARHGYAALALAYFHFEGLPPTLESIPLEYFGQAIAWMMQRPEVIPTEIGVMGHSRGGELALQLGALYPQIHAVVAYVPANVRYPSCCDRTMGPAWTAGGRALAYVLPRNPGAAEQMQAQIAVERIQGPILVISAQDDGVWPSSTMTAAIQRRLKDDHFKYEFVRLDYPHAGHRAGAPTIEPAWSSEVKHPVSGAEMNFGGTPEGNADSSLDAIPKVLDFLRRSLPQPNVPGKTAAGAGN
jgi:dienelactone hydrolase